VVWNEDETAIGYKLTGGFIFCFVKQRKQQPTLGPYSTLFQQLVVASSQIDIFLGLLDQAEHKSTPETNTVVNQHVLFPKLSKHVYSLLHHQDYHPVVIYAHMPSHLESLSSANAFAYPCIHLQNFDAE
jgi:hypothetical protein